MSISKSQKVAFITGANRGIGFETARQLAQLGVLPIIGSRTAAGGRRCLGSRRTSSRNHRL
jgi:NAD(P)-dependent dehydrogenase (short-subunit alcohol dehydrogenase family)